MLAASRTANVSGRINSLISSIQTMKGIRAVGVLCGIRCANRLEVFVSQPNRMTLSQAGSAIVRVKDM